MSKQQYLYFVKRPPLEEMEAVILTHKGLNNTVPLLQMKCRELARADVNCVVAPVPGANYDDNTAWAIAKIGYFSECGTQQKLLQLGFQVVSRNPVTVEVLQSCYQFSMIARMAPKWNRIGPHLVQGCEFFCTGKTCYVGVDINVTASEIIVVLEAGQIQFTFLKPEDLIDTPSLLQQYRSCAKGIITETSFENKRCTLLPNCTRGFVYCVSTTVPVSREFPTYNLIRMHWKRHHGFVLPDQQGTFYQIYFTSRPNQMLSYPGCCVLQYPPITYKCKDAAAICTTFVNCLHSRLPTLCGYPIHYTATRLPQPAVGLSTALCCQAAGNLLSVDKKPDNFGGACKTADYLHCSTNSGGVVNSNHPCKPKFLSMNKKIPNERRPTPNHSLTQLQCNGGSKSLSTSSSATASNDSHIADRGKASDVQVCTVPAPVSFPNATTTDSSRSFHKDVTSRILHHLHDSNSSLVAQISKHKVATLKKWLIANNIKFTAKSSKKDDLVKLVATHIKDARELFALLSEE